MRKKTKENCDKLLTPLIVKLFPRCLLCGRPTQVAHHYVYKSKSLTLRHDLKNLIPLCNKCHCNLHLGSEDFWGGKIRDIKGKSWFKYIEKKKQETLRYPDWDKTYKRLERKLKQKTPQ
jgi:hypothetical protein